MPAAAAGRRQGRGDRARRRHRSATSRSASTPPIRPACAASSACSRRATATRRWSQDLLDAMAEEPGRLHPDLPPPGRCRARSRRRRRRPAAVRRSRRLRRLGARAGAQRLADGAAGSPPTRQAAMRAVNPAFIPRNHRVEAVIAAAVNATISRRSRNCWRCWRSRIRTSRICGYAEPPEPDQRVLQTFCGT